MLPRGCRRGHAITTPATSTSIYSLEYVQEFSREYLSEFLAQRRQDAENIGPEFVSLVDRITHFVLSAGKRIRPACAWLGWLGAGGPSTGLEAQAAQRVCASLELLQAGVLIHDDIIDQSDLRRGNPSLHRYFHEEHRQEKWAGDSARHGEALAILAGQVACFWADDLMSEGVDALARADKTGFRRAWGAMRSEVIAGQCLDVRAQAVGHISEHEATRVIRWKTASYTVARPLELGGALAMADEDLLGSYREFGEDAGIAFQLADDLMGVFGDPAVTGKPAGDDVREGKRTVLMALAFSAAHQAGERQLRTLHSLFGRADESSVATVTALLEELDVGGRVRERIKKLLSSSHEVLLRSSMEREARTGLIELTATLLT